MKTRIETALPLAAFLRNGLTPCGLHTGAWPAQVSGEIRQRLNAGLQAAEAVLDDIADQNDRFFPVFSVGLRDGTLDIDASEQRPGIISISAPDGFSIEPENSAPQGAWRPRQDRTNATIIDSLLMPDFYIAMENRVFAAHIDARGISLIPGLELPAGVSAIVAPLTEWMERSSDDLVRDGMMAALDDPTPWNMLVAAGKILRWEPLRWEQKTIGRPPTALRGVREEVRDWSQELDSDQQKTAYEYVRASTTCLFEDLSMLTESLGQTDDNRQSNFFSACLARAELACVLSVVPPPQSVDDAVGSLGTMIGEVDELGDRVATQFRGLGLVPDPRIIREGIVEPLAWWTSLIGDNDMEHWSEDV